MSVIDLGMDADADAELERRERERQARRAAAQAEAAQAREGAGYGDAAIDRALGGLSQLAAEPPRRAPQQFQRHTGPFAPDGQARIGQVEQRLEAGDRAGVERDTRAEQGGPEAEIEDRALSQMARPAVTAASPAPMAQEARGTGSDPGMALPDPAAARQAPQSFQLREPMTQARRMPDFEAYSADDADGPDGDADADDRALASLAGQSPARSLGDTTTAPPQPETIAALTAEAKKPDDVQRQGMIPGEDEIGRARLEDGLRRPGRALAALFAGIGGRRLAPRESAEDQVRARQRQMLGDKRQARSDQDERAAQTRTEARQAETLEAQRALATRTADRQDAELDLARRASSRQDSTAAAQAARLSEQAETTRSERLREERMRTPGTDESVRAVDDLRDLVTSLPDGARERALAAMGLDNPEAIDGLTAEQAQRRLQLLPAYMRDATHRRGRSGGSGGRGGAAPGSGTPRAQWGTDEDPLVQAAIEANTDPRVARVAAADPAMRRQLARTLSGADVREGRQDEVQEASTRLPGYTRDESARRLSARESTQALNLTTADAEFNSAIANLERELAALTPAERVAGGLRQGSERYQVIQHSLDVMRTQFRQINNMGNALGAQEIVEHQFPDLSQGVTADAILANARAARRVKHAYVSAVLDTLGYRPTGGGGHGGGGHGGGGGSAPARPAHPPPPAPSGERVTIVMPDGRRATVPASQVDAAIARGARRAE